MTRLTPRALFKATAFVVIGIIAAILVSNTLRVPVSGSTDDFVIEFTNAEGLVPGNSVTMAGVRIGRVASVDLTSGDQGTAMARVHVQIQENKVIPERVQATVRYGDMLGARYISLDDAGPKGIARDGNTIPVKATTPPVSLTALMNGFESLFSALDPDQANQLARGFVDTFEGRSGSVETLLNQIATMGRNLESNKAVFGQLIGNMTVLMSTVEERSPQMKQLFTGLGQLTNSIVGTDGQLGALLDSGDRAVGALAEMMTASQGQFVSTMNELRDVTGAWIPHTGAFNTFMDRFPVMAGKINNSGRYGGFMMLYLCNFTLKAFDLEANIFGPLHSPVCR